MKIDPEKLEEVTSSRIYSNTNTLEFDENGLFSQRIFGPVHDYRCKCGKYSLRIYKGQRCPVCGVLCESSALRYKTFAKITIPYYIPKPNYISVFKPLLDQSSKHFFDTTQVDRIQAQNYVLHIVDNKLKLSLLDKNMQLAVYLRITGLYSLYLGLKCIVAMQRPGHEQAGEYLKYFTNIVLVLPPDIRPIVRDPKQKHIFHTYPINNYYRLIINLKEYSRVIKPDDSVDEQYIQSIQAHDALARVTEDVLYEDDVMLEHDRYAARFFYYVQQVYQECYELLSGKEGYIRSSLLGRTADFTARAVIVPDPSLDPFEVKLSKAMIARLWLPQYLHMLKTEKNLDISKLISLTSSIEFNPDFTYLDEFVAKHVQGLDE